jgi:hypothetical protein
VAYSTLWQHRHVVLATLDRDSDDAQAYASAIATRRTAFDEQNTVGVVTFEPVSGLDAPGVLVADKWGEIAFVATAPTASALPSVDDLLEWSDYLQRRCPECEGEAR